jgi:hypothetical protein
VACMLKSDIPHLRLWEIATEPTSPEIGGPDTVYIGSARANTGLLRQRQGRPMGSFEAPRDAKCRNLADRRAKG